MCTTNAEYARQATHNGSSSRHGAQRWVRSQRQKVGKEPVATAGLGVVEGKTKSVKNHFSKNVKSRFDGNAVL
eukprot:m.60494 g.60494  ORF g.60494 m.60494 type:complete len:73 (-) comp7958_c1_seq2:2295-2513(-)